MVKAAIQRWPQDDDAVCYFGAMTDYRGRDRRKPVSELKTHVLEDRDDEAAIAVCRICGPVKTFKVSGRLQCETTYRATRARHYKSRYGIDINEYEAMYQAQDGKCAVCDEYEPVLHVDHCHQKKTVRGLLCGPCNRGIGMFEDNIKLLKSAIKYLERTNG